MLQIIQYQTLVFSILVCLYYGYTKLPKVLLSIVYGFSALMLVNGLLYDQTAASTMALIKRVALLPLGLGTVLLFPQLPLHIQARYRRHFNTYINLAVLGNVIMMIFTPTGNTLRGLATKPCCLVLFLWLRRRVNQVSGNTVYFQDGIFIFENVPLPWIACHTVYRMVLVTLPFFQYWKLMLMEVQSLGFMYILWNRKRPVEHFFGVGDTLVVPVLSMLTSLSAGSFPELEQPIQLDPRMDRLLSMICCIVAVVTTHLYLTDSSRKVSQQK
jgi:hypothetical protein